MRVTGIIAEYNPFHNGHLYHIEQTRQLTNADYIICVMSGDFVQRGTPSIMDKYQRTRLALENGIDLVLELPTCYSTGSAEYFAFGSIYILNALGITDNLSFGSESGSIGPLSQMARLFCMEPTIYTKHLSTLLRTGLSFPKARQESCLHYFSSAKGSHGDHLNPDQIRHILTAPNNILAIEYLKALMKLQSYITPVTVKRKHAQYHDTVLAEHISSASAIRDEFIRSYTDNAHDQTLSALSESLLQNVPPHLHQILSAEYQKSYPITEDDFSTLLSYKLLTETEQSLAGYFDCHIDIARRILKHRYSGLTYSQLTHAVKSKNMTFSRISHILCHILLNIYQVQMQQFSHPLYIRVLGMQKKAAPLLRVIRNKCSLPIIQQLSKDSRLLDKNALNMLSIDIYAHQLYSLIQHEKFGLPITSEFKKNAIIMEK